MKALVTGAAGFIGSHLVRALVAQGHAVRALLRPGEPRENLAGVEGVEFAEGDVRDADALARAAQGCEAVFHLAALVSDFAPWSAYVEVNVEGTRRALDAAAQAGARRLVLVSSLAVHAYVPRGNAKLDEETPRDARHPYGRSKIEAEELCEAERRIETAIARPGLFPFGERDRTSFLPLARALERGRVPLVSGGRAKLCAVYAGDLADALVLCATHPAAARRAFILADPEPLTWSAWLGRIAHSLDAPPPRRSVPRAAAVLAGAATEAFYRFALPGRAPPLTRYRAEVASTNLEFSGERARRELGWSPRVGLEEGLRRTAAWARPLIREA